MISEWIHTGLEILFPPRCPGCGEALPYRGLPDRGTVHGWGGWCGSCRERVMDIGEACPTCGQPHWPFLDGPAAQGPCAACLRDPPPWALAACAFEMSGPPRDAVLRSKTGGGAWTCHTLARHLASLLPEGQPPAVLVPVPLHAAVWARRGFNQAEELARGVAASTGATVAHALERTRQGTPQKQLGRADRRRNVEGAFRPLAAADRLKTHRVILVDDVITTTATLRASAAALATVGVRVHAVVAVCREP